MRPIFIACLLMLVAGVVLALSLGRMGWFPSFAFCGGFPFLILLGAVALCVVGGLVLRGAWRRGSASCRCWPPSGS